MKKKKRKVLEEFEFEFEGDWSVSFGLQPHI